MATFHLLSPGYAGDRVASTVSLVEAGSSLVVIDPGMVVSTSVILDPIRELDRSPGEVTDVILSHHHPDHTINIALFPNARVHDHWAVYKDDVWTDRPAEGFEVAEGVTLWRHRVTAPRTSRRSWMTETKRLLSPISGGTRRRRSTTLGAPTKRGRERVLEMATLIVPGRGPPFVPDDSTSR